MKYDRPKIIKEILLNMGNLIIDIELDKDHLDLALDMAIDRYRLRSNNSLEESFLFLDIQTEVQTYTLPDEVQEVMDIYRRTTGGTSGTGAAVDPFALAFTNNLYLLGPGGIGQTGVGTLALYEVMTDFQKQVGKMFGQDILFTYNRVTKKLFIERKFLYPEQVLLHIWNTKTEQVLLNDAYARPWIRAWAVAQSKLILSQARSKFASLAGPQGGISLNGEALKTEALEEMARLEEEIKNFLDTDDGMPLIFG